MTASLTPENPVRCLVIFFSETFCGYGGGWEWGDLGEINLLCKIILVWILGFTFHPILKGKLHLVPTTAE